MIQLQHKMIWTACVIGLRTGSFRSTLKLQGTVILPKELGRLIQTPLDRVLSHLQGLSPEIAHSRHHVTPVGSVTSNSTQQTSCHNCRVSDIKQHTTDIMSHLQGQSPETAHNRHHVTPVGSVTSNSTQQTSCHTGRVSHMKEHTTDITSHPLDQ